MILTQIENVKNDGTISNIVQLKNYVGQARRVAKENKWYNGVRKYRNKKHRRLKNI